MKYKVKKDGDFENTIEIDIDFEDLESKKDEAISKISKSLKVKGFRPGKIPKNIVIREVGEDYILEESIDLYLPEQIFEILQKEEINPAVRPVVKDLKKEKKSYKVDVLITLWPKLSKLPKLNQTVEVESITPTEEEISDQIDKLLKIAATTSNAIDQHHRNAANSNNNISNVDITNTSSNKKSDVKSNAKIHGSKMSPLHKKKQEHHSRSASKSNANRAVGADSFFASTDREFFITGVQMEAGDSCTEFQYESFVFMSNIKYVYFNTYTNI